MIENFYSICDAFDSFWIVVGRVLTSIIFPSLGLFGFFAILMFLIGVYRNE